jgi:hypothetical protein
MCNPEAKMVEQPTDRAKEAIAAMRAAPGKPDMKPDGKPPLVEHFRPEGQIRPGEPSYPRVQTLIGTFQDMAARDAADYTSMIESLRVFVEQKRADLDAFEKLVGTKR